MFNGLLAVFVVVAVLHQVHATTKHIYVSPGGNDNNLGTIQSPYRTLQKAADKVAALRISNPNDDIQVNLRAGEYRLTSTLQLNASHSGTASVSVTFTAYEPTPGQFEHVLVDGGQPLQGYGTSWAYDAQTRRFTKDNLNPVFASLPAPNDDTSQDPNRKWEFRDLYWGNVRLPRARFPNSGYLDLLQTDCTSNCPTSGVFKDYPCGRWLRCSQTIPGAGQVHFHKRTEIVARHEWVPPRQILGDIGGTTLDVAFLEPQWPLGCEACPWIVRGLWDTTQCLGNGHVGDANWPCGLSENGYNNTCLNQDWGTGWFCSTAVDSRDQVYFENSDAFLDANYEWFFDSTIGNGRLTMILPPGYAPYDYPVVVPTLDRLIVVKGTAVFPNTFVPVQNIHFKRINFAFTHFPIQKQVNDPILSDGGPTTDRAYYTARGYAATQGGYRKNWNMVDVPRVNFMPAAIQLYAVGLCTVEYCRVAHTGSGGLQISGSNNTVANCEIFDTGATAIHLGAFASGFVPWAPPKISAYNIIENNYIHNFGVVYQDTVGLLEDYANNTHIRHNEIECGPSSGISSGWAWAPSGPPASSWGAPAGDQGWGTEIHYNRIHSVMRLLSDGGGIYVPGNHTTVEKSTTCYSEGAGALQFGSMIGNWLYDIHKDPAFVSHGRAQGIYLEQGSRGWHICGNVLEDMDYPLMINIGPGGSPTHTDWVFHSWRRADRVAHFDEALYEPSLAPATWNGNYYALTDLAGSMGYMGQTGCAQYAFDPSKSGSGPVPYFSSFDPGNPGAIQLGIVNFSGPVATSAAFLYNTFESYVHATSPAPEPCD